MIRILTATLFSNGHQETIELNVILRFDELPQARQKLARETGYKNVFFTYKQI